MLKDIPELLQFDVTETDIGDSIKISHIQLPEGVKPTIRDRDFVVATIVAPTIEIEETKPDDEEGVEEGAEGAEGEEGAEGAEGEVTESKKEAKGEDTKQEAKETKEVKQKKEEDKK